MPALAIIFISIFGSSLLSVAAAVLNGISLRKQSSRRSGARYLELAVLCIPFLTGATLIAIAAFT